MKTTKYIRAITKKYGFHRFFKIVETVALDTSFLGVPGHCNSQNCVLALYRSCD